jgi:multidrug efflux system outer membrane protein
MSADSARIPAVLAAGLLLAGCAVGPDYKRPEPDMGAAFESRSLVESQQGVVETGWWKLFADPQLDELVARALESNRSLAAAEARLKQARASRREQRMDFLPAPTATARATSQRQSLGGTPGNFPVVRDSDLYEAGFDASWELDLFGRVRRGNQAARATISSCAARNSSCRCRSAMPRTSSARSSW